MIEGNPTEGQVAAAPVAIDYDAMGAAVARSLAHANAQPAQTVSAFQEAIKKIEADPENDKETLSVLTALFEAHKADLGKESEQKITKMLISERVRQANQALDAEINRMVEADEKLKPLAPAVKVLATQDFDNSKEQEANRNALFQGTLDMSVLRKLVSKHFTQLSGGNQSQAGLTGMKTEGVSQAAAQANAEAAAGAPTFDKLNERQRELYYSILAENDRAGIHASGFKTREEAEKNALERASKKFK